MANMTLKKMDTEAVISTMPCTCIDGRTQGTRFSAAGGSFALAVHVMFHQAPYASKAQIQANFAKLASEVAPIYLHSDQHAFANWLRHSQADSDLKHLDLASQQRLLASVGEPAHIGCGYLGLMAKQDSKYQSYLNRVLQAFFELYFADTPNMVFEVLAGEHNESQALFIEQNATNNSKQCEVYDGQEPVFFCHRPLKKTLIERICQCLGYPDAAGAMLAQHNLLAQQTIATLSPKLPHSHIQLGGSQ